MRIVTYDLEKNENDMPMLVRGSSSCTQPGFAA